MKAQTL
jgi:hypothetical protein